MKTVGLIGGIGPQSTIEYYRSIVTAYRERKSDGSYPSIIINSIDLTRMLAYVESSELDLLTEYLSHELDRLRLAGAHFAAMASNTPHIVFDRLQHRSSIPLISIVEATCTEARSTGLSRLALFGTRYTMQSTLYSDVFAKYGMEVISPEGRDQIYIHEKYMGELINGIVRPETREALLGVVERMKKEYGIEGLILGGTELSLILSDSGEVKIPILNTAAIHVNQIVAELLQP